MKCVIQRVSRAEIRVAQELVGRIGVGLVLLVAVEKGDTAADLDWLSDKVLKMRVFEDSAGKMNRSALDVGTGILVVSQFTLAGDLSRGRRPGFERAASAEEARALYDHLVDQLTKSPLRIATGRFGAYMEVELVNDGPVTFILESSGR